ncbi:MAG TPA: toprim domain-containing protein [Methanocella sp.]|nr:toprim domain-containing protein [Methanocella sp.]
MIDECERLEQIQQIIDELRDRSLCGAVVLVEGRRDREALELLGVRGEIVTTSHRQLLSLAEELARAGAEVIILSDWDDRGDEVARQVQIYLEADGIKPDLRIRDSIKGLVRKEIKDVESLYNYMERLRRTCASKPQHY